MARPIIHIPLTPPDRIIQLSSFVVLSIIWIYCIVLYQRLPDIIPVHFDIKGNINGYGNKNMLWVLAGIATVLAVGLNLLAKVPHIYNYPTEITEENAERQYRLATRLLRGISLSIAIVFLLIVFLTDKAVSQQHLPFNGWVLVVILGLVFIPIGIYFYACFKKTAS